MSLKEIFENKDIEKRWFYVDDILYNVKHSYIWDKQKLWWGIYPVIWQDREYISGFSSDDGSLFKNIPVILFWDHTWILKLIDFNFIPKGDAIKLLKIKDDIKKELILDGIMKTNTKDINYELITYKYLYYFLLAFYKHTGDYSRHFSKIKKIKIFIPNLEIQQIIVKFLDKVIWKLDDMYFLSQILYHTENRNNSPSSKFKKMLEYIADKHVSLEEWVKFIWWNEMVKNYVEYVETYFWKKEDEEETKWKEYLNQDNYWDKIYEEELGRVFWVLRSEDRNLESEEASEEVRREEKRGFRVEIPEVEIGENIEWRWEKMPDIWLIQKWIKPSSWNEKVYIDLDFLRKWNVKYVGKWIDVEKGDLILVWDWSNAGDVFVSPIDWILSSTFAKISIRKQWIYNKYVYYYLIYLKKELLWERTWTWIPHINWKKLSKKIIPIPYNKKNWQPDIETQQKIVAYLDKFTEFINYQKAQTKNLQENILKAKDQILKSVFGRMM